MQSVCSDTVELEYLRVGRLWRQFERKDFRKLRLPSITFLFLFWEKRSIILISWNSQHPYRDSQTHKEFLRCAIRRFHVLQPFIDPVKSLITRESSTRTMITVRIA